eukprot:6346467-Prymnesium_polylepis.1
MSTHWVRQLHVAKTHPAYGVSAKGNGARGDVEKLPQHRHERHWVRDEVCDRLRIDQRRVRGFGRPMDAWPWPDGPPPAQYAAGTSWIGSGRNARNTWRRAVGAQAPPAAATALLRPRRWVLMGDAWAKDDPNTRPQRCHLRWCRWSAQMRLWLQTQHYTGVRSPPWAAKVRSWNRFVAVMKAPERPASSRWLRYGKHIWAVRERLRQGAALMRGPGLY